MDNNRSATLKKKGFNTARLIKQIVAVIYTKTIEQVCDLKNKIVENGSFGGY